MTATRRGGHSTLVLNKKVAAKSRLVHFTSNVSAELIRYDTMEGKEFVVVPMVMMTEGVHNGSRGGLYYPEEELSKTPAVWNHKPVVVYHPTINGEGISACDPEVLTAHKIGIIMNTRWDELKGRLTAEAWLEKDRVMKVDERVWNAIEEKKVLELSTGLFTDNEASEGEWNGESYTKIARNYRPDHLAVLPDQIGACSVADGAGFIRNELRSVAQDIAPEDLEMLRGTVIRTLSALRKSHKAIGQLLTNEESHEQIREQLCQAISKRYPQDEGYAYPWVEAVYDAFVIYSLNGRLFKLAYSASDAGVKLSGEPVAVSRITEYRTEGGAYVGNAVPAIKTKSKETTMNKDQLVADLITNGGYSEEQRQWLMSLDVNQLKGMQGAATAVANRATAAAKPAEPAKTAPATNAAPVPPVAAPKMEDVLNANQQAALQYGQRMLTENKAKLITEIKANPANPFSDAVLNAKSIEDLEGLAALARSTTPAVEQSPVAFASFAGNAPVGNAAPGGGRKLTSDDALEAPGINWNDEVAAKQVASK